MNCWVPVPGSWVVGTTGVCCCSRQETFKKEESKNLGTKMRIRTSYQINIFFFLIYACMTSHTHMGLELETSGRAVGALASQPSGRLLFHINILKIHTVWHKWREKGDILS